MRSVWIFLSSVAVVIAVGGIYYQFLPRPDVDLVLPNGGAPPAMRSEPQVTVLPPGNPLLAADALQLDMWIPSYPIPCGEIVFGAAYNRARNFAFCLGEIRSRVAKYAKQELSDQDVLDPRVRAHWRATARGK